MSTDPRRVTIDQGAPDCVALGICWCGARYLRTTRDGARQRLADHEARAHPDVYLARNAAGMSKRRVSKKSARV